MQTQVGGARPPAETQTLHAVDFLLTPLLSSVTALGPRRDINFQTVNHGHVRSGERLASVQKLLSDTHHQTIKHQKYTRPLAG
ncbi:hypothetical protein EYF80_060863 [Liparis tanakae]|uniref:Uncharacterized protein n=1 Tax=Liparis tanakae TaxID=230148 RepID=A0A4Z2EJL7_9TELE|nr:hypothetical protein EYF80_060863 [Liparis tanakae]